MANHGYELAEQSPSDRWSLRIFVIFREAEMAMNEVPNTEGLNEQEDEINRFIDYVRH